MAAFARTAIKKLAFQFRKITPDHYKDVMYHLRDACQQTDPLNLQFCKCLRRGGNEFVDHFAYKTFSDNLSFMILNEDKKVTGVILNGISRPQDFDEFGVCLKRIEDQTFRHLLQMKYQQNKKNNIFKKFNIKEAFDVRLISVDRNHNTSSLAKHLIYMSELLAKNQKFKLIKSDTFGDFSEKHLKKCGFQCLNENYMDFYKNKNFNNQFSDTKLQLLYKYLGNV